MTKQEEYHLNFTKIRTSNKTILHYCVSADGETQSQFFSTILGDLDDIDTEELITSIEAVQNGQPFEEYHNTDAIDDGFIIKIVPPNLELGTQYVIALDDWKELMQEWLDFIKPRSLFGDLKKLLKRKRDKNH